MFDSQVLETAIGLVMMFFIIALGASSLIETISRLMSKRAADLEKVLKSMLGEGTFRDVEIIKADIAKAKTELEKTQAAAASATRQTQAALDEQVESIKLRIEALESEWGAGQPWEWFEGTTVYASATSAAGKTAFDGNPKRPSYLSAKAFADGAIEMVTTADQIKLENLPGSLGRRAATLKTEFKGDLLAVKAGLEQWFDDAMQRLEGSYKRWVTFILFGVSLFVAVSVNASTFHVAERLWQDPVTRQAVVAAADNLVVEAEADADGSDEADTATADLPPDDLVTVAETADKLGEVSLPVGWDTKAKDVWSDYSSDSIDDYLGYIAGWVLTAFLVTLGAPFWFDLLTRLSSLRGAGGKPPLAPKDEGSASTLLARETGYRTVKTPAL